MSPEQTYTAIAAAIERRKEQGLRIVWGGFGNQRETCCALSALEIEPLNGFAAEWFEPAANLLGIELNQVDDIVLGFDGRPEGEAMSFQWWEVGSRLRFKFNPKKYGETHVDQAREPDAVISAPKETKS